MHHYSKQANTDESWAAIGQACSESHKDCSEYYLTTWDLVTKSTHNNKETNHTPENIILDVQQVVGHCLQQEQ